MVDLLLLRIRLSVAFADALGDDAGITLGVASVLAVLALHACGILEEIAAECTPHDVVELVLDELVAVHLVNLFLTLPDGAFSAETKINLSSVLVRLDKAHLELNLARRL